MHFVTILNKEKLAKWFVRLGFNLFPAYRRSGGRVIFISNNWKEIQVKLSLNLFTRNYVGTVFGGCIYAALDPIYMFQLIKILGKNYVVWDKAATIKFIRPIKTTVFAKFIIEDNLIDEIIKQVSFNGKHIIELPVSFQDKNGQVYALVTKQLYIASKQYYQKRP